MSVSTSRRDHKSSVYTVMVVQADGVPNDVASFGTDLRRALEHRDGMRESMYGPGRDCFIGVYDADDPERGYFDWPEEEAAA